MIRIFLVRHGETYWNAEGRFQGRIDVELNESGLGQAERLGQALKDVKIDAVYCSPLKRSLVTAEAIAGPHGLAVREVPEFNEIDHGVWEGMTIPQVRSEDDKLYETWLKAPEKVKFPGGEDLAHLMERVVTRFEEILKEQEPGDTIVIVGHDATNKALLCHALGLDGAHFWQIKQGNASLDVLEYEDGRLRVTLVNDTCHLGGVIDATAQGAL